jgi:hypothetical protein
VSGSVGETLRPAVAGLIDRRGEFCLLSGIQSLPQGLSITNRQEPSV